MTLSCRGGSPSGSYIFRFLFLAIFLFAGSLGTTTPLHAQPDGEGQQAQQDAGEKKDTSASGKTEKKEKDFVQAYFIDNMTRLVHVFITSLLFSPGSWWVGILFLALSIIAGILFVVLLIDLRLGSAIPLGFVEEFTKRVNSRQFKQAFELCNSDNSFLAKVMTAGMGRLQYGIEDARHAAGNMVESLRRSKDQLINYVAIIATVAPLLGLFGTVWGMVGAFQVIEQSAAEPRVQEIAGEIAQSLSTTFVGILLAIPALFFHTYFRNRLSRMTMDTSNLSDDLLTQMYHNSRKAGAGGGVPTTAGGPTPGVTPVAAPSAAAPAAPGPTPGIKPIK